MHRQNLASWFKLVGDFENLAFTCRSTKPGAVLTPESLHPIGEPLLTTLRLNGFSATANRIERGNREWIPGYPVHKMANDVGEILHLIEFESSNFACLKITPAQADWYDKKPKDYFGDDVFSKLEASRYDMEEALKCFALERYTASVGHLTKITESAIRVFAENVLGKSAVVGTDYKPKSWHQLSQSIRLKLDPKPKPGVPAPALTARAKKKKDVWLLALERFDTVRVIRNDSHHPDQEYSHDEAHEMLIHLPGFLKQVMKVI